VHQRREIVAKEKIDAARSAAEVLLPLVQEHPRLRNGSFASAMEVQCKLPMDAVSKSTAYTSNAQEYAEAVLFLEWIKTKSFCSKVLSFRALAGIIDVCVYRRR
jgi:predicted translin family RNA/ssDNA-binding protein